MALDYQSKNIDTNLELKFWEDWLKHKDYLYQCCVKWMGHYHDAEDALSQAMIKARDKVLAFTGTINNFKAWLTKLTYNLCLDIHRKRHKGGVILESWEAIAPNYEDQWISQEDEDLAAMQQDLDLFFRGAIDDLPVILRDTCILFFQKQLSYREIAEKLQISYDNVRKRISQSRVILRQKWYEYEGEGKKDISLSKKKRKCKTAEKRIENEIKEIECEEQILVESEKEIEIEKPEIVKEFEEEKLADCVVEKEEIWEKKEEINVKENDKKNDIAVPGIMKYNPHPLPPSPKGRGGKTEPHNQWKRYKTNQKYNDFACLIMIKIAHNLNKKMFFCPGYLRRLGGFNKGIDSS